MMERGLVRTLSQSKFALVATVALGLAACDKGSKSGSSAGGSTAGKGMAGASAVAPKGGLSRALSMMPVNSEMVIALDFKQVRASALWKKYEDKVMGKIGKDLEEFKAICGWDPMDKAAGALMAGRGREMDEMTVFVKGFDKPSVTECLKKAEAKGKADNDGRALVVDGDYFEMTKPGKDPIRFMFADADTIVLQRVPGSDDMAGKAALEKVLAAKDGEGLMSSPMFSSLIDATDTSAALWFVVNGAASFMKDSPMPMKLVAVFGSVKASDGIDGAVKLRLGSPDDAKGMVSMAEMGMGQLKGSPFADLADGVKISAKGSDVVSTFKFTQAQLDKIAGLAAMGGGF
ncbi:MAG: hypothetical protein R3B06_22865 [Kofleriaceae bacterium]